MAGKGSKPGQRLGGRAKGTKNKATVAREEEARARIAESIKKAGSAPTIRFAITEMQKAISIAEGLAGLMQPHVTKAADGTITISGGDMQLFGEWFDRYWSCAKELAKYQVPQIKAIDAPTPPPDPKDLEQRSRKRFGLRIFEGGRPLPSPVAPVSPPIQQKGKT